jgi:hypothetical protein
MAFVSAGAYAREIDLSLYAETLTNTIFAMAHTFNKGPIGEPTLVTNVDKLLELFGEPIDPSVSSSACQGWFAAREYLRKGNQLYVTRVESAATPAEYAAQAVQGPTDQSITTGTADTGTSIPATRTLTNTGATFDTDGVLAGDVVEIHDVGTPGDNGFYTITVVAATVLTVNRDWPVGSLANVDYTVWTAKNESGATGATSASSTRQLTQTGAFFTSNVVAGDILKIHDDTDTGDNGIYVIASVDSATQVTVDRDWPIGSLTNLTFTIYGSNSAGTDGSTATAGEFLAATAKFQSHDVQAGDILWIKDSVDTGDNGYYLITGLKTGSEETTLEINQAAWPTGALTGLDYEILPGSITFQGASKGTAFRGLYLYPKVNPNDPLKFDLETRDSSGSLVLEKVYALDRSNVVTEMTDNDGYWSATVSTNRGEPAPGKTFTVSGGDDGYTGITGADYIGDQATKTGLKSFYNAELIDINLVACPGVSTQTVQDELVNLSEKRADCMALVDPPDWASVDTVQEILNYHNGTFIRTTALNTTYAGLWWTWQKVYDEYHETYVWIAPSGHMAGVMAHNDNVQAPWYAPAGLKRAKLVGSLDVRYSPDQDDRDALQGPGARVNPIVKFTGEGIYAFGQKTLSTTSSALNRINVRRMLLYCEKVIATAARQLIFDPNDEVLDREFVQLVEPVLDDVLSRRGIREYKIVVATTDTDRENNKAVYKLFIKPTKAAEIIEIQFVLTSQGADFQELLAA